MTPNFALMNYSYRPKHDWRLEMVKVNEPKAPKTPKAANTKPATLPKTPAASKTASTERRVIYPEIIVERCMGDKAITAEAAKRLLGWESEADYKTRTKEERPSAKESDTKFSDGSWILKDEQGQKVRCYNNSHNRPFTESWARQIGQDILNRHWADSRHGEKKVKFIYGDTTPYTMRDGKVLKPGEAFEDFEPTLNGETIIIGRYGNVLSGQHRLIGLILAAQIWAGPQHQTHWMHVWAKEPTIEGIIVYGVDESSVTTRTLDNVRPRSLSDVLFTEDLFNKVKPKGRQILCRALEFSIRTMWSRTGWGHERLNAWAPKRTHSESLDFLSRHERLKRTVKHVWEEDGGAGGENGGESAGKITKYLGLGYSSALCYLMACSESDGDIYRNQDPPSEKKLSWEQWDKALEFWTLLAGEAKELRQVYEAFSQLQAKFGGKPRDQSVAILVRAWNAYAGTGKVTALDVDISDGYKTDDETGDTWYDFTADDYLGGIDLPDAEEVAANAQPSNSGNGKAADPSPAQIAEQAKDIKLAKIKQQIGEAKARRKGASTPPAPLASTKGKGSKGKAKSPAEARNIMEVLTGDEEPSTDEETGDVISPEEQVDSNGIPPAVDHSDAVEDTTDADEGAIYIVRDSEGACFCGHVGEDGNQVCDGSEGEAMEMLRGDVDVEFPNGLPEGWVMEKIGTI